ncbi:hypothetical protein [Shewanella septentrionalis]|uniref:hypothetical protein n=1 Tax=Shewanella septentrionalis TaxID=2952223 RepID=UPI0031583A70
MFAFARFQALRNPSCVNFLLGRYWVYQELGKGFSNHSACDRLGEALGGGNLKHELKVPVYVAHYLCKEQWALMGFDSKKSYIFWLIKVGIDC